ncbi:MAG: polyprenyl synthetase family protein, partial [Butyricicoccus sp.]|nr:polyprenyl synthetase family protein [Butyricicoccus sp.]
SMGMCAGQYLDTAAPPDLDERSLRGTHALKTGALISAACQIGVSAAGGTQLQLNAAGEFGSALGMAFQIRDDVLDAECSSEQLGKTAGSDERGGKTTFFTLLGPEGCEREIARLSLDAKNALSPFDDAAFLLTLTDMLAGRNK